VDLALPDADGVEVFSTLLARYPDVPLVVLTGREDAAMGLKAVQMGVQDYLTKQDINRDLLVRSIRYAIERHTLQEELAHARRQAQREKELERADRYTTQTMNITAQMFGSASLRETVPDTFESLLKRYETLLDLALEERTYKVKPRLVEEMRTFTEELEFLRAGPRDLMDLHVRAIRHKLQLTPSPQVSGFLEEGRFVLVELLGTLLSHYRSFAIGLPAPPEITRDHRGFK
jgi:DNA-binding response OmpR family regulator